VIAVATLLGARLADRGWYVGSTVDMGASRPAKPLVTGRAFDACAAGWP